MTYAVSSGTLNRTHCSVFSCRAHRQYHYSISPWMRR